MAQGCLPSRLPLPGPSSVVPACRRLSGPSSTRHRAAGAAAALRAGKKSGGGGLRFPYTHPQKWLRAGAERGQAVGDTDGGVQPPWAAPTVPCFPTLGRSITCAFGRPRAKRILACPGPTQQAKQWGKSGPKCHYQSTQLLAGTGIQPALKSQALLKSGDRNNPWSFASLALGRRARGDRPPCCCPSPHTRTLAQALSPMSHTQVTGVSLSPWGYHSFWVAGFVRASPQHLPPARWGEATSSDRDPLAKGEIQPQI